MNRLGLRIELLLQIRHLLRSLVENLAHLLNLGIRETKYLLQVRYRAIFIEAAGALKAAVMPRSSKRLPPQGWPPGQWWRRNKDKPGESFYLIRNGGCRSFHRRHVGGFLPAGFSDGIGIGQRSFLRGNLEVGGAQTSHRPCRGTVSARSTKTSAPTSHKQTAFPPARRNPPRSAFYSVRPVGEPTARQTPAKVRRVLPAPKVDSRSHQPQIAMIRKQEGHCLTCSPTSAGCLPSQRGSNRSRTSSQRMAFIFLPPPAQIFQHALPGAMQSNFHRGRFQVQNLGNFLHRIILQFLQNQNFLSFSGARSRSLFTKSSAPSALRDPAPAPADFPHWPPIPAGCFPPSASRNSPARRAHAANNRNSGWSRCG